MCLADQFIACGKSSDIAQELASQIWVAVLDRLEENRHTFCLLKSLAQEGDVSELHTVHLYKFLSLSPNNSIHKRVMQVTITPIYVDADYPLACLY